MSNRKDIATKPEENVRRIYPFLGFRYAKFDATKIEIPLNQSIRKTIRDVRVNVCKTVDKIAYC